MQVVIGIGNSSWATHIREWPGLQGGRGSPSTWAGCSTRRRDIINYENLGIGRLIYQLPTTLCEMFLQEVFKKNPIDALDQETLFTINKFFENNLNVSETAQEALCPPEHPGVPPGEDQEAYRTGSAGSLTTPSPSRWR